MLVLRAGGGGGDDVALQEDAPDAVLVLALADGVEGVVVGADVAAHAVHQLVLGHAAVRRPAMHPMHQMPGQHCRVSQQVMHG